MLIYLYRRSLGFAEVKTLLQNLNMEIVESTAQVLFENVKDDISKEVGFSQFVKLYHQVLPSAEVSLYIKCKLNTNVNSII